MNKNTLISFIELIMLFLFVVFAWYQPIYDVNSLTKLYNYYSLCPKYIVRFLEGLKTFNFDASYLKIEWPDVIQILKHFSLNKKMLRREIWGQSLHCF